MRGPPGWIRSPTGGILAIGLPPEQSDVQGLWRPSWQPHLAIFPSSDGPDASDSTTCSEATNAKRLGPSRALQHRALLPVRLDPGGGSERGPRRLDSPPSRTSDRPGSPHRCITVRATSPAPVIFEGNKGQAGHHSRIDDRQRHESRPTGVAACRDIVRHLDLSLAKDELATLRRENTLVHNALNRDPDCVVDSG